MLDEAINKKIERLGDWPCLTNGKTGQVTTNCDLMKLIKQFSVVLKLKGFKQGECVHIVMGMFVIHAF